MNVQAASRRSTITVVLLSIVAFATADQNPAVFVLGVPAAVVAWLITSGSPPRALPRFVINILLFIVVAWGTLTLLRDGLGVSLFSQFVAALMIVKLLDRQSCRDTAQIITLSVFLVIGAILTSNSFVFGVVLMVFVPAIISCVLWYQLARVDEHAQHEAGASAMLLLPVRLRAATVFVLAMMIGVMVFLLMPREIGSRALGAWGSASVGRVIGFNDEVRLGIGGLISESREPVLDLQLFDRSGEHVGSVGRRFYLRGAVLNEYDSRAGTWVRGDSPRNKYQLGPPPYIRSGLVAVGGARPSDWTTRQEITIRNIAGERGHLFSLWRANQVQVSPPARLEYCSTDSALRVQGHTGRVSYTVYSNDQIPSPMFWFEYDREERLAVMLDMPAVGRIARELLEEAAIEPDPMLRPAADDHQAVAILRNHFTAGDFRYTLDTVSAPPGRDPIEWFLTENREGHCEYYAAALAAMCRTVGINARVITGYVATDFNPATSSYIVRASNAHAWVEAETLPGDWRVFDPTPTADLTRIHEPPKGLLASIRRFSDTLEFAWIRTVVGYDAERRTELLGAAEAEVSLFPILDRLGTIADDTRRAGPAVLVTAVRNALVTFCVATMLGVLFLRGRDRLRLLLAEIFRLVAGLFFRNFRSVALSPERAIHRDLLNLYRRAGTPKPHWIPLRTHTLGLIGEGRLAGKPGDAAARLSSRLYAAFFGGQPLDRIRVREARADLDTLRAWAVGNARAGRSVRRGRSIDVRETRPHADHPPQDQPREG